MAKKIIIGADHGGYRLKESIKKYLAKEGYAFEDVSPVYDKNDDYVDYAERVARRVVEENSLGVLLCRSAAGMVIAANKIKGVRAVAAFDIKSAVHSRQHNDANVLALSGNWLTEKESCTILNAWLSAEFSGEARHVRRLRKIERLEK